MQALALALWNPLALKSPQKKVFHMEGNFVVSSVQKRISFNNSVLFVISSSSWFLYLQLLQWHFLLFRCMKETTFCGINFCGECLCVLEATYATLYNQILEKKRRKKKKKKKHRNVLCFSNPDSLNGFQLFATGIKRLNNLCTMSRGEFKTFTSFFLHL